MARLANELGRQLVVAEARRAERAPNPNSIAPKTLPKRGSFSSAPLHLTPAI